MPAQHDHTQCFAFLSVADRELMGDYVIALRNGLERRYREDSIRTYTGQLAAHFRACLPDGASPVTIMTRAHITRAMTAIEHTKASTRRNRFFALKSFARFLWDVALLDGETFHAIASMKFRARHTPQKARLTEEQTAMITRHLLESPNYRDAQRLLLLTLIATMGYAGLRSSEACKLGLADVDFDACTITVRDGKGGKNRILGIPARIVPLLRLYLEHRPDTTASAFFVGDGGQPLDRDLVVKRLRRLSKATGIHISAHMLRRRFATRAAHRGVPLDQLQLAMGHSDVQTTRGYVLTSENEVARAMRAW